MNFTTFNKIVQAQLHRSETCLISKGNEYAERAVADNTVDRLAHFKKAGALQGESTAQAAFGMLAKHLVSVSDMVAKDQTYPLELWDEKITDSINYLLILRAIVAEGREK